MRGLALHIDRICISISSIFLAIAILIGALVEKWVDFGPENLQKPSKVNLRLLPYENRDQPGFFYQFKQKSSKRLAMTRLFLTNNHQNLALFCSFPFLPFSSVCRYFSPPALLPRLFPSAAVWRAANLNALNDFLRRRLKRY